MTDKPQIVLGSRNLKKSGEIKDLLAPHGIDVISVAEVADLAEVVEDGASFAENAAKKAREPALELSRWVLAEDSGLMVDALEGRPGIYSARYAGENASDQENNEKLLMELADVPAAQRSAGYVCSIALSDPEGQIRLTAEASCRGRIIDSPRGSNGFGYDPLFMVPEYHRTFGELDAVVKQRLSHRARAFARFIPRLVALFSSDC
ncbi:Non-canonical purine NTP pyrophosphatase [Symmachiella dynata]|uniref:RdgB/HAM1 family non-canonical purine NTP pyrophosphatase n=1 Tax=Symmachiella dynata TaxID=2527995 RepID=UPI0011878F2A|nr:RdgB/HAM1 family non-canonical purine NTP pyrophosphatase [Symmachiella dynata]QDT49643.1 Non-canonical purine NTP pyrophosphatase [Symmachiella dynata]